MQQRARKPLVGGLSQRQKGGSKQKNYHLSPRGTGRIAIDGERKNHGWHGKDREKYHVLGRLKQKSGKKMRWEAGRRFSVEDGKRQKPPGKTTIVGVQGAVKIAVNGDGSLSAGPRKGFSRRGRPGREGGRTDVVKREARLVQNRNRKGETQWETKVTRDDHSKFTEYWYQDKQDSVAISSKKRTVILNPSWLGPGRTRQNKGLRN